jgi:hypothetical protein
MPSDCHILANPSQNWKCLRSFRAAFTPSEITLQLRELVRWRKEIVQQRTTAYQRLRALLAEWCFPSAEVAQVKAFG